MKVVHKLVNQAGAHVGYLFWCEGCECGHQFTTPPWTFNGDFEKPTVRASILVRYKDADPTKSQRCHLFITDGKIQYLADCTHKLAGQTLDMVPP